MNDDLNSKQNNSLEDDFSDELLNNLQELDDITDDMQEIVGSVKESKKSIQHTSSPATIDSATVSLEAAKISQASAENSQQAIEAAIKLSHEQKKQTIELSDSTIAWRNSVSKANKIITNSKSAMAIMLTVSIVISLIAMGVVGYLYYSLNKKSELMKGEVLDIIATELSLSGKKSEMKLDQLASLFETLNARPSTIIKSEKQVHQPEAPQALEKNADTSSKKPVITINNTEIKEQLHAFNQKTNELQAQQTQLIKNLQADIKHNQTMLTALTDLVKLTQSQISAQTNAQVKSNTDKPIKIANAGLTDSQFKKINNISWAIHKQGKVLKEIKLKLNKQTNKTYNKEEHLIKKLLIDLKQQINQLQQQQTATQSQVQALENATKKLSSKPRPYRYQSRD